MKTRLLKKLRRQVEKEVGITVFANDDGAICYFVGRRNDRYVRDYSAHSYCYNREDAIERLGERRDARMRRLVRDMRVERARRRAEELNKTLGRL